MPQPDATLSSDRSDSSCGDVAPPILDTGLNVVPAPQIVRIVDDPVPFGSRALIRVDETASDADCFAAEDLGRRLSEWGISARVSCGLTIVAGREPDGTVIDLTRRDQDLPDEVDMQGYRLTVAGRRVTIAARGEAGIFYGTRTLLQLLQPLASDVGVQGGYAIPSVEIVDWPDIGYRAAHYDTKHHQDKAEYVRQFIRRLADTKINMLVWEWEDKFAYRSHPEIGAPGAFTMAEMQAFTRYARQYHIQLVPLVQGLGHVSFILKWPEHAHLREIPASNWEFCPLKDGTYDLLADLWAEAIEATPGSEFIHIGTDETYELGLGEACECRAKAEEIGERGLLLQFLERATEKLAPYGRRVMCWGGEYRPGASAQPPAGLIVAEFTEDLEVAKASRDAGYPAWVYDPNPGIEHLFLPYFLRLRKGQAVETCLEASRARLTTVTPSGLFEGMINTSWDDSGLHNQVWMMSFAASAEWSWSGSRTTPQQFVDRFFVSTYGSAATDLRELWQLLNEGGYFYMDAFERKVWHWGDVGKTHLPDLPRGDAVEIDPFWNREYAAMVDRSRNQRERMQRAIEICRMNLSRGVRNAYDFELFTSIARLVDHTAATYLALSELENAIIRAHKAHFVDHSETYAALEDAAALIEGNLAERDEVFIDLMTVWEKTSLPKGLWTEEKSYFHQQDRARHFANRRPDMTYLIYDEQLLDLEGYLESLRKYTGRYRRLYSVM